MNGPPVAPVTTGRFVVQLLLRVPETADVVAEHLEFVDGPFDEVPHAGDAANVLLLHLLMGDVLAFAVETWHDGRRDVTARVLAVVDDALRDGDEYVVNAVCVSFVEHVGADPGETPEFIASWPAGLLAQRERSLEWHRNWRG